MRAKTFECRKVYFFENNLHIECLVLGLGLGLKEPFGPWALRLLLMWPRIWLPGATSSSRCNILVFCGSKASSGTLHNAASA